MIDVETSLAVRFLSGNQWVIKELLERFATHPVEYLVVIPVVHCRFCRGWRQLSDWAHPGSPKPAQNGLFAVQYGAQNHYIHS